MAIVLLAISSSLNFLLGSYSLFKNYGKYLNLVFFFFAASIAGWIFSIFVILKFSQSLFWGKMPFIFAVYSLSFLLLFILGLGKQILIKRWVAILVLVVPTALSLLILFDHVIESVRVEGDFIMNTFGPMYLLYTFSTTILALLCFGFLVYQFRTNYGIERLQIKYVALGIFLFILPAILTNLILPTFLGIWEFNTTGPFFSFFMILSMTYAIMRYHLMDIWVVVRLGTIYAALFTIISFFFSFASSALANYAVGSWKYILPALVITFGFIPLKNGIEHVTDNIFFRKKFRYENLIHKFNESVHALGLNLHELLQNFNLLITNDLKASTAAIFLTIPKGNFISRQVVADRLVDIELAPDNPIISYLHNNCQNILDQEILKLYNDGVSADVIYELDRLNFALVLPIVSKSQLIGIYGIGPKKSQDPYGSEELELLRFLASESAHVIDNARYFEDLKKIDAAKSKFISVTSHELRTPLTSILWNLEFLMSRKIKNKSVNEMLGYAYYSASFINDHLDDMLTALDFEEKKDAIFLKKERFQFSDLVKESIDLLKSDAEKKKIVFDVVFPAKLQPIYADRAKIRKTFIALLRNSVYYSALGGHVSVKCKPKELNGQSFMECIVSDRGMGITEEEKSSIFSKFYRSEAARLASPNGLGISLFIAKHFIEAHGGELWFASDGRDKGTEFIFKIPV